MKDTLKVGDRVRVKAETWVSKYPTGDRGTVVEGLIQFGAGRRYFLVEMDRDRPRQSVVFTEGEIEPDV